MINVNTVINIIVNLLTCLFSYVYTLEGMMLKLKLQYFGHLMRRADSLEKTLMLGGLGAGGEGDDRGWDGWMASLTWWTWVWVNFGRWWWTGRPGVLRFMGLQRVRHDWATELNMATRVWEETYKCIKRLLPWRWRMGWKRATGRKEGDAEARKPILFQF